MASNSVVSGRAARRTAARKPAAVVAPPLIEQDLDEPFDEEDLDDSQPTVAASTAPENDDPALGATPVDSVAVRATSARHGAIALPVAPVDRSREITESDVVTPKLRISQGLSDVAKEYSRSKGKAGVAVGEWYVSSMPQSLGETVYFVPLAMQKSRGKFDQGVGLVCRSYDLIQGVGTPGILCEGTPEEIATLPARERGCEFRLWNHNDWKQPPCGEAYNYPGLIIENIDDPAGTKLHLVVWTLRSKARVLGKTVNTTVLHNVGLPWYNAILELGTVEESNPKGTYFVPTVELFDDTMNPAYARIRRRAESLARSYVQSSAATAQALEADSD